MSKKIVGLDILRIFSMFGIVGLHVINNGGILNNLSIHSYKYYLVLLLLIIFYTSVDIFALLSGYLNVEKKDNKNSRIIELISIVAFYCILLPSLFYLFNIFNIRSFGIKELIKSFLPILIGRYWYITSYVFLFLMIPYINKFIKLLCKVKYKKMLILLSLLLSILPNMFGLTDFFKIENGYSPFWLIYLYMVGAYIKLYLNEYRNNKKLVVTTIICLLLAFIFNCIIRNVTYRMFGNIKKDEWFINYISPFIIVMSICLLILFKNIDFNSKLNKIISYFSSCAFSVYIIHSQRVIFDYVLKDAFVFLNKYNGLIIFIGILLSIIFIYIVCSLIDILRKMIFKYCKINDCIKWIGNKLDKILN